MSISNSLKVLSILVVFTFLVNVNVNAQSSSTSSRLFSDLSIKNKVAITFFGSHHFDNEENGFYPGVITTERSSKKGFVNFSRGSSWTGASELQHVDGYVCVYHTEPFTFPIGANFKYRPVAISGARASDAAYFDEDPQLIHNIAGQEFDTDVKTISDIEYWDINGENRSHITLTWDEYSNVKDITNDELALLSIVGWKNNRWEVVPSKIDKNMLDISAYNVKFNQDISSFKGGSITTLEAIPINSYDFYTFGAINSNYVNNPAVATTGFNVYPNPHVLGGSSKLTFKGENVLDKKIRIYNSREQLVFETSIKGNQKSMILENVAEIPGVYTIQITDSNGSGSSKNLIVVDN